MLNPELAELYARRDEPAAALPSLDRIAPLPVEAPDAAAIPLGEAALCRGEVAVLLVAGGQGTRLGFDKPKGVYKVGPVSGASLFQIHAEKVLALRRRYQASVPFLIMTSPLTHAETVADFDKNKNFGLDGDVHFFQQGTMPALDLATGEPLLEAEGRPFLSPNGHGGTLTALADSGLLATMKARGVKHIFYFQVDNPLVKIAEPAFLGAHIAAMSEVSSKVVYKEQPEEKVGVLALIDGRCGIIEYSDLPAELATARAADGTLLHRAGNPAIHLFSVGFLEKVTDGADRLQYHIARKKVPYYDVATKSVIAPTTENALKFELFIFDALPLAVRWLAVEAKRDEEFAPLKNATGPDSPETVRRLMIDRAARWLEACGCEAPNDAPVEISPLYALDETELAAKITHDFQVRGPMYLH